LNILIFQIACSSTGGDKKLPIAHAIKPAPLLEFRIAFLINFLFKAAYLKHALALVLIKGKKK
jgi:hypothetical protein